MSLVPVRELRNNTASIIERARRGDQPGRRQEAGERRQELGLSHRAMVMGIGARRHGVDYTGRGTDRAPDLS